ncbi:hypothetical protein [Silvibacterium bohemicum]|nr:hypothetical protein [Silvibacterium bohemicum]
MGQAMTQDAVAADPVALVRRAVANELKPGNGAHPYRYKLHKVDNNRVTTKEIIETKDGDVARLIEYDGHPLGPVANQDELDRLNNLLQHPEVQEHRHKREQADSNRANEMIRLLPDAFLYHFESMEQGPSGQAVRLSLKPNPAFHPPDREAEVYAGMAGELWIDQQQERMVKLDVHLIDYVNFGWGILGKLYKGGSILVEQKDVGNDHWEQYHFKLNLHGKALMLKSLEFDTTEDETDFAPVSAGWGYQDAVKLLLTLKPPVAEPSQLSQR